MKKKRPRIKTTKIDEEQKSKIFFDKEKKKLDKEIKKLDAFIENENKNPQNLENNKKRILEIENTFKKKGIINQLKYNQEYSDLKNTFKPNKILSIDKYRIKLSKLKTDLNKIKVEINNINSLNKKKRTRNIKQLKQLLLKTEKPIKQLATNNEPITRTFEADWVNIYFDKNKITIKHNSILYHKYIPTCKKYLNEIKPYYKFHNVPKLKIKIVGEQVIIENQEVLFYHIDFLNISASNFRHLELPKLNIKNWKKYTIKHYKTHLPFLFHTHTLKKLCKYCDSNLPIIPVGEVVLSSNDSSTIHNSFLFPIKSKSGCFIVWESTEEGRASYVFSLNSYSKQDVQNIFDFIAGNTRNKRSTLLSSKELQQNLKMSKRILHTDLIEWENNIKYLAKK